MESQANLYFTSLRELVIHEDGLFVSHFLRLYDPNEERDKRALRGLVAILTYEGRFDRSLEDMLAHELSTMDVNSGLLRGSTLCTRWVTEYLQMHHSFLEHKFRKLIQRLARKDREMEIDPHRVSKPKQIASRTDHLIKTASRFLATMCEGGVPTSLQQICATVHRFLKEHKVVLAPSALQKGDQTNSYFAVSNTLFLHLLCPFLANPPAELVEGTKHTRRALVLVAKMLQAVANGTSFDADWMRKLNPFVEEKRATFEEFCERVVAPNKFVSRGLEVFSLPLRVNNASEVNLVNRWKAVFRWLKGHSAVFLDGLSGEQRQYYECLMRKIYEEVDTVRNRLSPRRRSPGAPQDDSLKLGRSSDSNPMLRGRSRRPSSSRHKSMSLSPHSPRRRGLYGV